MTKKAAPQDMHPADVTAALKKRGLSMRQLSIHHGYGPSTLHVALHRSWPKGEKLIADALGTTPDKIWPSRHQPKRTVAEVLAELRNTSQFSAVNDTDASHISASKAVA